jgi:hypothetical protein
MQRIYCDCIFNVGDKSYTIKSFLGPTIFVPNEDCKIEGIENADYVVIPELVNMIIFANLNDYLFYINIDYFHYIVKSEFQSEDSFRSKHANITMTDTRDLIKVLSNPREVTSDEFTTLKTKKDKILIKMLIVGNMSPNYLFGDLKYIPKKYSHITAKEVDKIKNTKKYFIQNEYSTVDKSFVDDDTSVYQVSQKILTTKKIDGKKIMVPVYVSYYSDPACCIMNGKPSKKLLANLDYFDVLVINYTPKTHLETDNFIPFANSRKNIICFPDDYPIYGINKKYCMLNFLKHVPEKTSDNYIHEVVREDTSISEKYEKLKQVIRALDIK